MDKRIHTMFLSGQRQLRGQRYTAFVQRVHGCRDRSSVLLRMSWLSRSNQNDSLMDADSE